MAIERPKKRRRNNNRAVGFGLLQQTVSSSAALISSNNSSTLNCSQSKKPEKKQSSSVPTLKVVNLDSDEEQNADVSNSQVSNIKNRLDSFFQEIESSEDEFEKILTLTQKPENKKDDDFYTVLSDGDDIEAGPSIQAGTNGLSTFAEMATKRANVPSQKTNEKNSDLFTIVDDILKDCDSSDVNTSKQKMSPTQLAPKSLEDMKKESEQILGNVSSLLNDFIALKKAEEEKKSPEGPSCPICLDPFAADVQIMTTICGHIFCKPCITKVAKSIKKCPTCRKSVNIKKIHPIYMNI
ncbi:uncharacterized protein LOC132696732 isoform X2 [Cylas formicarius]|nr:uncharacterized protein LOC132696732 isoform X2 [Cylas formicarius]